MPAEPPEDASTDFEDDNWWLIAKCIASGEKNIGLMNVANNSS
jgi:hypothetical protein